MIYMDVDAALSEVPVNSVPLTSDSDFKTIQTAVAYNAAGMALNWHFVTAAGAYSVTAVTPTTAGDYDWTHQGQGMYSIEIPASAGASINNDTEGYGYFTGHATGVLPWRGPTITFRASGLNDLLIESAYSATRGLAGTALPAVASGSAGAIITAGTGTAQLSVSSGRGDADIRAIDANTSVDTTLKNLLTGMFSAGTVTDTYNATTTTTFDASGISVLFNNAFRMHVLRWTSGVNIGLTTVVKSSAVSGNDSNLQEITLVSALVNAPSTGDTFLVCDANAMVDLQTIKFTTSAGAAGYVGLDWGNITAKTTTNALTGTTISTSQVAASVTGAVGSVTGNVGGNVTGSVGSIATGGIAAASFAAGAINAAAIATDAIGASELAADAVAEIADAVWDELQSGHTIPNTFGKYLDTEVSGVGGGTPPTAAAIADAVWDEARSGHVAAGSFGEGVASVQGAVTGAVASVTGNVGGSVIGSVGGVSGDVTGNVSGSVGSVTGNVGGNLVGTIGGLSTQAKSEVNIEVDAGLADVGVTTTVTGRIDAAISTRLATAGYTAPDNSSIAAILTDTNELQSILTDGGTTDLILDAIKAKTDNLPASPAATGDIPSAATIADAVLDEATSGHVAAGSFSKAVTDILADTGTDGVVLSTTTLQSIADTLLARNVSNVESTAAEHTLATIILAMLESSRSGTTWTIKRTDGSTTHATKTLTVDASADPITGVE